jgi:hypothetical protein
VTPWRILPDHSGIFDAAIWECLVSGQLHSAGRSPARLGTLRGAFGGAHVLSAIDPPPGQALTGHYIITLNSRSLVDRIDPGRRTFVSMHN